VLVLAPTYFPWKYEEESNHRDNRLNLWIVLATNIQQLMDIAVASWEDIGTHLQDLIDISTPRNLRIDDERFSQVLDVLWVIGKLDEILPMVRDSLEQWEWFRAGNSKLSTTTQESPLTERQHDDNDDSVENLLSRKLQSKLQEIDRARQLLENCEEEFKTIYTRSLSLKDSVSWYYSKKHNFKLICTSCCN
jgi:hypothetical protein